MSKKYTYYEVPAEIKAILDKITENYHFNFVKNKPPISADEYYWGDVLTLCEWVEKINYVVNDWDALDRATTNLKIMNDVLTEDNKTILFKYLFGEDENG